MTIALLAPQRSLQTWESEGGALASRAPSALTAADARAWILNTSHGDARAPLAAFSSQTSSAAAERKPTPGYPKLKNDRGVPEIRIGARQFECIGESPPNDHPHVHIDMGSQDTILCPYCGTRYRTDAALSPGQADPEDSLFAEPGAAIVAPETTLSAASPAGAHAWGAPSTVRRPLAAHSLAAHSLASVVPVPRRT